MKRVAQINCSKRLKEKRKKIDFIDRKLLSLLNQRLRTSLDIQKIKKEISEKIYNPKREREIVERLKSRNRGLLKEEDLEKIFVTIIKVCRLSQKKDHI